MTTWPYNHPAPGVYFNMPFADYLAIPALQSSSLKNLLVSGPNFWAESWMNPFRKNDDKQHFALGRAYHKRILEGRDAFYAEYATDWEDPGDPDIIRTTEELRGALALAGQKTTFKNKDAGIRLLAHAAPQRRIAEVMRARHMQGNEDKEALPAQTIREIELTAKSIESNPHINTWLAGGQPEVTVIWMTPEDGFLPPGLLIKARFDYLKIGAIVDLKTFANEKGKQIDKAIDYAIAGNKYFVQSSLYLEAAEQARKLIAAGNVYTVGLNAGQPTHAWLDAFDATPVTQFRFIFSQKGMAFVTAGRIHDRRNEALMAQGNARLVQACRTFNRYHKAFGTDLWVSMDAPQHIDFGSLPAFAGDL